MLKKNISGIVPVNPSSSKLDRAQAVFPLVHAGNVYLPEPGLAPWIGDYVNEMASFPMGAHDDQVDATTQALEELSKEPGFFIGRA